MPTPAILWWIGLGIEVIQNNPGCPQENGTVEGLQRISSRWSKPEMMESLEALQDALDQTGIHQREIHRMRKKRDKTRIELYPELKSNERKLCTDSFSIERVTAYMSQFVFIRKVTKNGRIRLAGCLIPVNSQIGKEVTVKFDHSNKEWIVRSVKGNELIRSKEPMITEKMIREWTFVSGK